jgi:hypothetical protein
MIAKDCAALQFPTRSSQFTGSRKVYSSTDFAVSPPGLKHDSSLMRAAIRSCSALFAYAQKIYILPEVVFSRPWSHSLRQIVRPTSATPPPISRPIKVQDASVVAAQFRIVIDLSSTHSTWPILPEFDLLIWPSNPSKSPHQ